MDDFIQKIIDLIKLKNRDQTFADVKAKIAHYREWMQENGEWALLVGVLAGIILVLFFKALVLLVFLGGASAYVIWELSDSPNKPHDP